MRPRPFVPRQLEDDRYVIDETTGTLWHRLFHRPLYADVDRSDSVYHANYLRFFELGRATLMRERGYPYSGIEAAGFLYPVVETKLRHYAPLAYDTPMWIHTRPAQLERVRVRFEYVIIDGESGHDVCRGYTLHCALDKRRRVVAVDEQTTKLWHEWEDAGGVAGSAAQRSVRPQASSRR